MTSLDGLFTSYTKVFFVANPIATGGRTNDVSTRRTLMSACYLGMCVSTYSLACNGRLESKYLTILTRFLGATVT